MRNVVLIGITVALCLLFGCLAVAADKATEAKSLVEQAVTMAKEKGVEKALKVIGDPQGPFVKGSMYVFSGDFEKNSMLAHPYAPESMLNKDLGAYKDPKGNQIFLMFGKAVKDKGSGWVDYWFMNPGLGVPQPKRAFIMRVPGSNVYMGSAYYTK